MRPANHPLSTKDKNARAKDKRQFVIHKITSSNRTQETKYCAGGSRMSNGSKHLYNFNPHVIFRSFENPMNLVCACDELKCCVRPVVTLKTKKEKEKKKKKTNRDCRTSISHAKKKNFVSISEAKVNAALCSEMCFDWLSDTSQKRKRKKQ